MSVLSVQAAGRRFADRVLFSDVSFRLTRGDRAGLIGPNGAGKTTVLRVVGRGTCDCPRREPLRDERRR